MNQQRYQPAALGSKSVEWAAGAGGLLDQMALLQLVPLHRLNWWVLVGLGPSERA